MPGRMKAISYRVARGVGLFRLAGRLTRRSLRILCYHGISTTDEHEFRPRLFVTRARFEERMDRLSAGGTAVLPLDEALHRLRDGTLPDRAVAITFDDGFYSSFAQALPILKERGLPATVYVTSYYALKGSPVFRLAAQYLFWKTQRGRLDLSGLALPGSEAIELPAADEAMWRIIHFAERELDEPARVELTRNLAERLGVDYDKIERSRALSMMNSDEIREASASGFDLQLHTHRHELPTDAARIAQEISENRAALEPLVGKRLEHLCYPSGIWSEKRFAALQAAGIQSATTCDAGLNTPRTPLLALHRFLDGQDLSQIEFDGELSGFSEWMRRVRFALLFGEGGRE